MRALLHVQPGVDLNRRVASLSLLHRNLLTLHRAGVSSAVVYAPNTDLVMIERALQAINAGSKSSVSLEELHVQVCDQADELSTLFASADDEDDSRDDSRDDLDLLILSATRVHDRDLGAHMKSQRAESQRAESHHATPQPLALTPSEGAPILMSRLPRGDELDALTREGISGLARVLSERDELARATPPTRFIDREVTDDVSASLATQDLWRSCRKPIDGWTSRYINRYLSLAMSRRLVDTPITPNMISVFCILLGFVSLWLVLQGTYLYILWGAIAFKANSVIDGVDGELARVRWQFSPFGETLDSLGDNVANFSFFGGLAYVLYQRGDHSAALLGIAGLSMWAVHLVWVYLQLARKRRGDVLMIQSKTVEAARGPLATVFNILATKILRRDSFVFLSLIFSVIGWYEGVMLMVLIGGGAVFGNVLIHWLLSGLEALRGRAA